jgi:hypothetical protein
LVYFWFVWYIFSRFGMLYKEKIWQHCSCRNKRPLRLPNSLLSL